MCRYGIHHHGYRCNRLFGYNHCTIQLTAPNSHQLLPCRNTTNQCIMFWQFVMEPLLRQWCGWRYCHHMLIQLLPLISARSCRHIYRDYVHCNYTVTITRCCWLQWTRLRSIYTQPPNAPTVTVTAFSNVTSVWWAQMAQSLWRPSGGSPWLCI
jgi:hypothetical protein